MQACTIIDINGYTSSDVHAITFILVGGHMRPGRMQAFKALLSSRTPDQLSGLGKGTTLRPASQSTGVQHQESAVQKFQNRNVQSVVGSKDTSLARLAWNNYPGNPLNKHLHLSQLDFSKVKACAPSLSEKVTSLESSLLGVNKKEGDTQNIGKLKERADFSTTKLVLENMLSAKLNNAQGAISRGNSKKSTHNEDIVGMDTENFAANKEVLAKLFTQNNTVEEQSVEGVGSVIIGEGDIPPAPPLPESPSIPPAPPLPESPSIPPAPPLPEAKTTPTIEKRMGVAENASPKKFFPGQPQISYLAELKVALENKKHSIDSVVTAVNMSKPLSMRVVPVDTSPKVFKSQLFIQLKGNTKLETQRTVMKIQGEPTQSEATAFKGNVASNVIQGEKATQSRASEQKYRATAKFTITPAKKNNIAQELKRVYRKGNEIVAENNVDKMMRTPIRRKQVK